MVIRWRYLLLFLLSGSLGTGSCTLGLAFGYNPVTQQAQTNLTAQGFDPGTLDGIMAGTTVAAIESFQSKSNLPITGVLDQATLKKLAINTSVDMARPIQDWRPLPSQAEINSLVARSAYADYAAYAPGVNIDIPGKAILSAMNENISTFGGYPEGHPKYNPQSYQTLSKCLKNAYNSTHLSDLALHYYCHIPLPRVCYSAALSGKFSGGVKLTRTNAYASCASGKVEKSENFTWVVKHQPLVFQYVMFGQTHAFNHEQEQAVINAFYGVQHPDDPKECRLKRPRRFHDPIDGSHCLVNKVMLKKLVGMGA